MNDYFFLFDCFILIYSLDYWYINTNISGINTIIDCLITWSRLSILRNGLHNSCNPDDLDLAWSTCNNVKAMLVITHVDIFTNNFNTSPRIVQNSITYLVWCFVFGDDITCCFFPINSTDFGYTLYNYLTLHKIFFLQPKFKS